MLKTIFVLSLTCIGVIRSDQSGFQLFLGTTAAAPHLVNGVDTTCVDKLDSCHLFGKSSCGGKYLEWATDNCRAYCGICLHGPTTPVPPCEDKIKDCESYGSNVCDDPTYSGWVQSHCRFFCRHKLCQPSQIAAAEAATTTIAPENCVDKVDCRLYGQSSCTGSFRSWAKENCMNYCKFCNGTPTVPPPCVDKIPDCSQYEKSTCSDDKFKLWAQDNCRKYCQFCTSSGNAVPMLPGGTSAPPLLIPSIPGKKRAAPPSGVHYVPNKVKREDSTESPLSTKTSTEKPPFVPTVELPTTMEETTESPTTTEEPTTTESPTTTEEPTTTESPTTTEEPTTIEELVTTVQTTSTSTEAPPTTAPTTTEAPPPTTSTSTEAPPPTSTSTEAPPPTTPIPTTTPKPTKRPILTGHDIVDTGLTYRPVLTEAPPTASPTPTESPMNSPTSGSLLPGSQEPGSTLSPIPGGGSPGTYPPPGSQEPGSSLSPTPGGGSPGTNPPGSQEPGSTVSPIPGGGSPGTNPPGSQEPGSTVSPIPGGGSPGTNTPPGSQEPGSSLSPTPGGGSPGTNPPGSQEPGSTVSPIPGGGSPGTNPPPGSQEPGSTVSPTPGGGSPGTNPPPGSQEPGSSLSPAPGGGSPGTNPPPGSQEPGSSLSPTPVGGSPGTNPPPGSQEPGSTVSPIPGGGSPGTNPPPGSQEPGSSLSPTPVGGSPGTNPPPGSQEPGSTVSPAPGGGSPGTNPPPGSQEPGSTPSPTQGGGGQATNPPAGSQEPGSTLSPKPVGGSPGTNPPPGSQEPGSTASPTQGGGSQVTNPSPGTQGVSSSENPLSGSTEPVVQPTLGPGSVGTNPPSVSGGQGISTPPTIGPGSQGTNPTTGPSGPGINVPPTLGPGSTNEPVSQISTAVASQEPGATAPSVGPGDTGSPIQPNTQGPTGGVTNIPGQSPNTVSVVSGSSASTSAPAVTVQPSGIASGPTQPIVTQPAGPVTTAEPCVDKLNNCRTYQDGLCNQDGPYFGFAQSNCRAYCGFCVAPTSPHECEDHEDCGAYPADLCYKHMYKLFVEDNCAKYCGLCGNGTKPPSPSAPITTPEPIDLNSINCTDRLDNCLYYEDESCVGQYEPWAKEYCPLRCGYCTYVHRTCEDHSTFCNVYEDGFCQQFPGWSRTNCRKYCDMCEVPVSTNVTRPTDQSTGTPPPLATGSPTGPNMTEAESHIPSYTIQGEPSDRPGSCEFNGVYIAPTGSYTVSKCGRICTCANPDKNEVICRETCPVWDRFPNKCHLETPQGECCQKLICPSGELHATPAPGK